MALKVGMGRRGGDGGADGSGTGPGSGTRRAGGGQPWRDDRPVRWAPSSGVPWARRSATANGIPRHRQAQTFPDLRHGRAGAPSFSFGGTVRVGTVLPEDGVVYYDVPPRVRASNYNYTSVN